jgi:hypothetical protein
MKKRILGILTIFAALSICSTITVHATKPSVTTSGWVDNITQTSGKFWGNLTANGGYNVTDVGFYYGTSSSNLSSKRSYGYMGATKGEFSLTISGLTKKTTYYYCAYAVNSDGETRGSIYSFKTYDVPEVTTVSATSITTTSATLNGNLTANNGANVTASGFDYGTTTSMTNFISYGSMGSSKGAFSKTLSGLQPNTTYYYCAYAVNSIGEGDGARKSFTTAKATLGLPSVYSLSTLGVKKTEVIAKWNAVANATGYKISLRDLTTDTLKINNLTLSSSTLSYTLSSYLDYNHSYRFAITATNVNYNENWREVDFFTLPDELSIT